MLEETRRKRSTEVKVREREARCDGQLRNGRGSSGIDWCWSLSCCDELVILIGWTAGNGVED